MGLVQGTAFLVSRLVSAIKEGFRAELMKRDKLPSGFHHNKCIFIHIPKSAGTSICKSLFGYQIGHRTYSDYVVSSSINIDEYFKFSFVRNPWDRVLSAYLYLRNSSDSTTLLDKKWADDILQKYSNFNDFVKGWVNAENILTKNHFIPQYQFITDDSGVIKVDFLGRFESIDDDFNHIKSIIGVKDIHLPVTNKTQHKHYSHYYDDEAIDRVREVYAVDITTFNYTFDDQRVVV